MKIGNIIKKECEPILSKYGFKYLGTIASGIWGFERFEGEIKQEIYFQKSNYSKSITAEISVERKKYSSDLNMWYFIGKEDIQKWLEYETEEDLKEILNKLLNGFEIDGMEILSYLSIEEVEATENMGKTILVDTKKRANIFKEKYKLEYQNPHKYLKILEELIDIKKEEGEVGEEFLINAGAYLGEVIINNLGGKWKWDKQINCSIIDKIFIGKDVTVSDTPLSTITYYYSNPKLFRNSIIYNYKKLEEWIEDLKKDI